MKFTHSILVLFASFAAVVANADDKRSYDCGLVEGLVSASNVLYTRGPVEGNVFVFKAIVGTKYKQASAMVDELVEASKKVSARPAAKGFLDIADRINNALDAFTGDIDVFSRKISELDHVFSGATSSLIMIRDGACGAYKSSASLSFRKAQVRDELSKLPRNPRVRPDYRDNRVLRSE